MLKLQGLYRGVVINVQRAALVNLGELSTYDQAKSFILKHSGYKDGSWVKQRRYVSAWNWPSEFEHEKYEICEDLGDMGPQTKFSRL